MLITTGKPSKYNPIERILKMIDEMGLNDIFRYLGLVSREELYLINNATDLLLVCRSNSTYANYGFPWKLGKYCMTSKPIIVTRVGDIEKYFKNNEDIYIAEPENHIAIYKKMKLIFDDYKHALIIAKKGFEKACRVFDYKSETRKVIEMISSFK